ncbi:MAG: TMEM143 family protein [Planctomycetota bacterium]|jgi:hypothetical protein
MGEANRAKDDAAAASGAPAAGGQGRSHFIPFRKADVIDMCLADGVLADPEKKSFGEFAKILGALFHFEYHERLETLKDSFVPFNPDADARAQKKADPAERLESERTFLGMMREVLTQANYTEVARDELKALLEADPGFGLKLDVDLDDFAEVLIFRRERRTSTETVKRLRGMVKPKVVDVAMYDRVVVYIRFKDAAYFEQRKKKNLPFTPGESTLKLFQNVPETGLEMLFPNAKARMRIKDKLVLGLPSAIAGFGVLGKLYATIGAIFLIIAVTLRISDKQVNVTADSLVGLMLALFGIGLFMRKQINKFKGRKVKHLMTLAKNLYFKVLDNNAGVFHHLIDAAEEEDCKEAILAYYFLLTRRSDFTEPALDREVEKWFAEKHDTTLDFEVDDAMGKLERLELAYREGDVLRVKPLDESKKRIDWLWDNFFAYND